MKTGQGNAIGTEGAEVPVVSTIIPTYNRRDMVCEAIASALQQGFDGQEVVVVDDGSRDDTRHVLAQRFGSAIRYVYQDNAGVSAARNRGVAEARGRYIAFLDSDDFWRAGKLRRQVEFLDTHPDYGLVLTDVEWVEPNGHTTHIQRRRGDVPHGGDILLAALRQPTIVPSTALLRRSVFEVVGGFDTALKTAEDIDLYLRIASRFKVGLIDEPLTAYTSRPPPVIPACRCRETRAVASNSRQGGGRTAVRRLKRGAGTTSRTGPGLG